MNNTYRDRIRIKRFSPWNYLVLLLVFVSSMVYALPNLYGHDPSLLITHYRGEINTQVNLQQQILTQLSAHEIIVKSSEQHDERWQLRFYDVDSQFKAFDTIADILPSAYSVTYSLASRSPAWLSAIGASPMHLGLDLQGGIHLVYEVDTEAAIQMALDRYVSEFKITLQDADLRYKNMRPFKSSLTNRGVIVEFDTLKDQADALRRLSEATPDLPFSVKDNEGKFSIIASISKEQQYFIAQQAIKKNTSVFRLRANELGVSEPVIYKQGENRIVVQLPGVQDPARAIHVMGSTATLEFRLVHEP